VLIYVVRITHDRYLPPDRDAFVAAKPPTGRVIVIAPTRAACETIELAVGLHLDTFLERTRGTDVRSLAASGKGFGIVAGTGTGKTLAIRPIAETILGTTALKVGVVNREREATPETPTWNVVIVTTGIARRWFQDGDIQANDTLIVDEIHQTSAELSYAWPSASAWAAGTSGCPQRSIRRSTRATSTARTCCRCRRSMPPRLRRSSPEQAAARISRR
jgi:hypothetical protein